MEGKTTITPQGARQIMGSNVVGYNETKELCEKLNISFVEEPDVEYSAQLLESLKNSHLLILGQEVNILQIRNAFGIDPDIAQPCFYNQDWYLKQSFIEQVLPLKWYLIQKDVSQSSRAQQPHIILDSGVCFPSAVQCTYAFFAYYFATGSKLWEYDFVWCNDLDHNGDRIYVGKYTDVDGVNNYGFSIHRHLILRPCYGAVELL